MSTYLWNIEGDMCRCCHAEGSFKNLDSTCYVGSTEEVCVDLIQYALNIHVPPVEGKLFAQTYKICGQCIHKLIEVTRFRRQVVQCEKKFRDLYKKKLIAVSSINEEIKEEPMENISPDDDDDDKEGFAFNSDDDFHMKNDHREEPDVKPEVTFTGDGDVFGVTVDRVDDDDDVPLTEMVKPKMDAKMEPKKYRQKKRTRQKEPPPKQDLKVTDKKNEGTRSAAPPKFRLKEKDFKKKGNLYMCSQCDKTYDKFVSIKFHVHTKHYKSPKYNCPYCLKQFMTQAPLTVHKLEEHDVDDRFKCNACKGTFNTKIQLRRHINSFHMLGKKRKCELCDYESYSIQGGKAAATPKFRLQEKDFKKEGDLYMCSQCDKTYDKFVSIKFHVKTKHYKIPKYYCPYCLKQFMTPAPLTVHKLEEHNVDDRFKCNACKGTFNTKIQLRKHINNFHMLGEKYQCEFCDYESYSFEGMYKHKFKHKTVKDYHCRFCKKSFLRKTTLDLHERIHTGDRRKVCKVCGQTFVQKASLNYHMNKYHPEVNY